MYSWIFKEPEQAIGDLNKAVEIDPNSPRVYVVRGLTYDGMGQKIEALKDLRQAAQLYQEQGETADYSDTLELIRSVQNR